MVNLVGLPQKQEPGQIKKSYYSIGPIQKQTQDLLINCMYTMKCLPLSHQAYHKRKNTSA